MMIDIQVTMKFEFLPNEILIECFGYLNAVDIFYSFDQLNYRFNKLIRSIPLYLEFKDIHEKLTCNKFCTKMLSDQEIKKHIYSLHLSNRYMHCRIQSFLSMFSFNKFVHLRSLTLTEVKRENTSQLISILPLISELSYFRLIDSPYREDEIISALPISQLRTLIVLKLPENSNFMHKLSSIKNLTISNSNFNEVCQVLNNASRLKYLKVGCAFDYRWWTTIKDVDFTRRPATYLQQLIFTDFQGKFDHLVTILKQTPNLKSLTISAFNKIDMIDPYQWQHLINFSLPYLNIFKFKFEYSFENENILYEKFKEFQTDFWQKQHKWSTVYSLSTYSVMIHTLPYISNTYELTVYNNIYFNELMNNFNAFDNVINLTIIPDAIREKCQYYFSHVTSMTLGAYTSRFSIDSLLKIKQIEYLKIIVNLANVKHLDISSNIKLEKPSVLKEILKETPQLSSLQILPHVLISLFNDDELCNYLKKMIKLLRIEDDQNNLLDNQYHLNRFCKIFSSIERLICKINQADSAIFLLKHLTKLSHIEVCSATNDFSLQTDRLRQKRGVKVSTAFEDEYSGQFSILIDRQMY